MGGRDAPIRRVVPPPFDAEDRMVRRFIERVCALTPAEWDRLGGAAERAPPPVHRRRIAEVVLDKLLRLTERAAHAPLWRWWGVGPYRRLGEVLDRPYVNSTARGAVHFALTALEHRHRLAPRVLQDLYERVEPFVPWESLTGEPRPWRTP